jgi:hypothetical protein
MIVDLDDISYEPKGIPKIILRNDKDNTYNPNYTYDDKYGYIKYDYDYTENVINQILTNTLECYDSSIDKFMYQTFDEEIKNKFDFIKERIENIVGKPFNKINSDDIDLIKSKLDVLKNELCGTSGGYQKTKRIKTKRATKIINNKSNKKRRKNQKNKTTKRIRQRRKNDKFII